MRIVFWLMLAGLCLAAAGCGGRSGPGPDSRHEVVAGFYPLAYAAERVAPHVDVLDLTPQGSEPHDLELSPRDVQAVEDADVVLYVGAGFTPALEDAARANENAVDVLDGVPLRSRADPHVWLDPMRYAAIVETVAEALGGRAGTLVAELEALDREIRSGLARCERRVIVTSHAAFGYLADAYGLEEIALTGTAPEAEPSAREIEALVEEVRATGATTVFREPLVSSDLAETVAREAGVETAVLDPLEGVGEDGGDYFSIMRGNLAALRKALACR